MSVHSICNSNSLEVFKSPANLPETCKGFVSGARSMSDYCNAKGFSLKMHMLI